MSMYIHWLYFLVREELSLAKFEEILEQERRHYVEKGSFPS